MPSELENEITKYYKDIREVKQQKKRNNLAYSTYTLKEAGIPFESHNDGVHLVINNHRHSTIIDFWPSTGLWIMRNNGRRNRGIKKLLEFLTHARDIK